MDNFRDLLDGDCLNPKNFTMKGLDKFGDMLTFQIRRRNKYQTKVGGCCTILFVLIVIGTFAYYLSKFLDKGSPIVSVNSYRAEKPLDTDIISENFELYFIPLDITTGFALSWDEFWSSFH